MVNPDRPKQIDAALLYDNYVPFAYQDFRDFVQSWVSDEDVELGVHKDGSFGVLKIGSSAVTISQNDHPMSPDSFANALASPYMQSCYPDAAGIVASHAMSVFVTVGPPDIIDTEFEPKSGRLSSRKLGVGGPAPLEDDFQTHWQLAQLITVLLSIKTQPQLIHWRQSDRFIEPGEFQVAYENGSGWPFQVHPVLFEENETNGQGISVYGTEHFTGHHMLVLPTGFEPDRIIDEVILDMIVLLTEGEGPPTDGSIVKFKGGAEVAVSVAPPDDFMPRPYLLLDILKLAEPLTEETASPTIAASSPQGEVPPPTTQTGSQKMVLSKVHPNAPESEKHRLDPETYASHEQAAPKNGKTAGFLSVTIGIIAVVAIGQGGRHLKSYLNEQAREQTVAAEPETSFQSPGQNRLPQIETPAFQTSDR